MDLGPTELIVILVIVILLFGVGRISKIAGELGKGIKAFKEGLAGDEKKETVEAKPEAEKNDTTEEKTDGENKAS
jgi:sec-independent protein translocase protein TatA